MAASAFKKILLVFSLLFVLAGCSSEDGQSSSDPTNVDDSTPVVGGTMQNTSAFEGEWFTDCMVDGDRSKQIHVKIGLGAKMELIESNNPICLGEESSRELIDLFAMKTRVVEPTNVGAQVDFYSRSSERNPNWTVGGDEPLFLDVEEGYRFEGSVVSGQLTLIPILHYVQRQGEEPVRRLIGAEFDTIFMTKNNPTPASRNLSDIPIDSPLRELFGEPVCGANSVEILVAPFSSAETCSNCLYAEKFGIFSREGRFTVVQYERKVPPFQTANAQGEVVTQDEMGHRYFENPEWHFDGESFWISSIGRVIVEPDGLKLYSNYWENWTTLDLSNEIHELVMVYSDCQD